MAPVLQALVALTVCVLLRLFLLSQMSLVICDYLAHMGQVVFIILARILGLLRVLLKDFYDFAATL